jgi:chemotaxis protein methyltransferase CheR
MVDLLTTHTTSFFREAEHFAYLGRDYLSGLDPDARVRVWCAACSTGEEAYCLAMVLQDRLGADRWELVASDVSEPALNAARSGLYPLERSAEIPSYYLKRYALRGRASLPSEGFFTFSDEIKAPISFRMINLQEPWRFQERFDVIFLRNVMIYFEPETRHRLVRRMLDVLRPGGLMFSGHSESLFGISPELRGVRPAVYRREMEDRAA